MQIRYPEFECVFIGDNGQGDVRASELLVSSENGKYAQNLRRTYIHEVLPLELTYVQNQTSKSRSNSNICYFCTYIDAALDAYKHGLIRLHGLRKVVEEAKAEFLEISMILWEKTEDASAIFEEEKRISEETFALNNLRRKATSSKSAKDKNFSRNSNPDGMIVTVPVQIKSNSLDNNSHADETKALVISPPPQVAPIERVMKRTSVLRKTYKGTMISGWKKERRIMELNRAIIAVNNELAARKQLGGLDRNGAAIPKSLLTPMSQLKIPCRYPVGKAVLTEYGVGIVNRFRTQDGIYEVLVHWGDNGNYSCVSSCPFGTREDGLELMKGNPSSEVGQNEVLRTAAKDSLSLSQQSFYASSKSSCTPCCVSGTYVRVYLTASNLSPAPTPVPQYMSDTPRALSTARSAIWHQVRGLLGGSERRQGSKRALTAAANGINGLVYSGIPAAQSLANAANSESSIVPTSSPKLDLTARPASFSREQKSLYDGTLSLVYSIWRGINDDSQHSTTYLQDYIGCLVWTPFGYGHVLYVRRVERVSGRLNSSSRGGLNGEDMSIVRLHWGAIGSVRRRCTVIIAGKIGSNPVGIGGYNINAPYSSQPKVTASILKTVGKSISNGDAVEITGPSTAAIASYIKYSPQRMKNERIDITAAENVHLKALDEKPEGNGIMELAQNDERKQRSVSAGIELEFSAEPSSSKLSSDFSGDNFIVERKPRSYSETESNSNSYGTKYIPNWLRLPLFNNMTHVPDTSDTNSTNEIANDSVDITEEYKEEVNIGSADPLSGAAPASAAGSVSTVDTDFERDSMGGIAVTEHAAQRVSNDIFDSNFDENSDTLYF